MKDNNNSAVLTIKDLSVAFGQGESQSQVVDSVSFEVGKAEKLAIVGESGSGKSVTALSILQLHDPGQVEYLSGSIELEGKNLLALPLRELRQHRGRDVGMIFQEPMTSLNPVYTIGNQLIEPL